MVLLSIVYTISSLRLFSFFFFFCIFCFFFVLFVFFFFQAEDGIRDLVRSRGLGDVYKRQILFLWVYIEFIGQLMMVVVMYLLVTTGLDCVIAKNQVLYLSLIHI